MVISINGNNVELRTNKKLTLGEIVQQAERFAAERGGVITQITVNNQIINTDEEIARRHEPFGNSDHIAMLMDTPQNIIITALKEAKKDIPDIA